MASYFPTLDISGEEFDFTHLEPFIMHVNSDMAKKVLKVHVRFTNHCFTKGYEAFYHPAGEQIIYDHSGNGRTFCPIRYRLSLALPEIINRLCDPAEKVYQTSAKRNFFEIRRASRDEKHLQDLNMVIESAYPEDRGYGPPSLLGRIGFVGLCGRVFCGKPLATKR